MFIYVHSLFFLNGPYLGWILFIVNCLGGEKLE